MRAVAAFLNYRMPHLAQSIWQQVPEAVCINNGGEPITPPAGQRVIQFERNYLCIGGWNRAYELFRREGYDFVWQINDDSDGLTPAMLPGILAVFPARAAAVTAAFNSPHAEFHPQGQGLREVSWLDWCGPVVRLEALADVGAFDASFLGYGVDLDWCYRARRRGWQFYVHDGYVFHHQGGATAQAQGLVGVVCNLEDMQRRLHEKWGVADWTEMKTL